MTNTMGAPRCDQPRPVFLTDGGLETTLIFHDGIDLPEFAAFVLLETDAGTDTLRKYYRRYLDIAAEAGYGFVLESPTWRASIDWGRRLGYDRESLATLNRSAIRLVKDLREEYSSSGIPIVISGNIGPRGDGYVAGDLMTADEAAAYHADQVDVFAAEGADIVSAITLTYVDEAKGIVAAAAKAGLPSVISFTTETDGRLPDGTALRDAILDVDGSTAGGPEYYMLNCAHTEHFAPAIEDGAAWTGRIHGIRANASRLSHAELDEAETLDDGDPAEFGELHRELSKRLPALSVFGGCCGTDHRHVGAIREAIA